jgi:cell division transport system ATP-binding protein
MKIENLSISYWNKIILKNLNINIAQKEFIFLIWNSWSWKTSFIKSIIWDLKPHSWNIYDFKWNDIYQYSSNELTRYRRNIWIIFQDYKLLKSKNVRENVAFAMEVCWYNDKKIIQKVPEVLSQVWLLNKKESSIHTLSWWEAQRIAIARALIHDPEIIIWDEPTWDLDIYNAKEVISILLELNKYWKTIIIATHDDRIVNDLRKRVITFKNNTIFSDIPNWTYNL